MVIKGSVRCLFEQSGTFKNVFHDLGYSAFDYDIKNDFNQTDFIVDLFHEIELCFDNNSSLFDSFSCDDLVIAFFPCIYFSRQNLLFFNGNHSFYKTLSSRERYNFILSRSKSREYFYSVCLKLFAICDFRNLRLILENPYSSEHYLYNNFPFTPSYIDRNRLARGDYFVKPTQYFFLNCEPTFGFTRSSPSSSGTICNLSGSCFDRSLISPVYARNFICDNILGISSSSQSFFDF